MNLHKNLFLTFEIIDQNGKPLFSGSKDFLILPLNSLVIDGLGSMMACAEGKPLTIAMKYRPENAGEFRIFSKKDNKWLNDTWKTKDFLQIHMVQAFQDETDNNIIYLDTAVAGNGDNINSYYYDVSNFLISLSENSFKVEISH